VDTPIFVDGIGRRQRTVDSTGEEVETLRLCRPLSEAPSTEPALIERAGRLAAFGHPSFAQVRRVERLKGALGGLTVVSAAIPGMRLSDVLALAQRKWQAPDFDAALYLLEQTTAAMAALHRHSRDLSHGTLGPERIVIRPDGHPVIVEHVLAPAITQLQMSRASLWTEFRVPAPAVAGAARLDQMTDIMQLGVLSLALMLGRPIRREEFPQKLQDLLGEASTPGALGPRPAVARALHGWTLRTLQSESRAAFRTMSDAAAALDALVAEQPRHKISPAAVTAWIALCEAPGSGVKPPAASATLAEKKPAETSVAPSDASAPATEPAVEPAERRFDPGTTTRLHRAEAATTGRVRRPASVDEVRRSLAQNAPPVRHAADRSVNHSAGASVLIRSVSHAVTGAVHRVGRLDWSPVRRAVQVAIVAVGLVGLFGATYLGAREYFGLPSLIGGRGTLVVESTPSGAELYVDGQRSGRTPATLELRAGEHTLALRAGRGTTLVPVTVVSGARRVERVEIRQRRQAAPRPSASRPASAPAPGADGAAGK
jgi:hypothetical protein